VARGRIAFIDSVASERAPGVVAVLTHRNAPRTDEGRKRAMARDVKFGRPPKMSEFQRRKARERLDRGEVQADVARSYGVSPATISILANA
jgi:CO/xanthine dehydrogenase Mo-binding subunit